MWSGFGAALTSHGGRRLAGHNKWSKVKHKKARTDARKGKIFTRIAREIQVAVRAGGDDPQYNAALRAAVAAGKAENMPGENIDRAIKRGLGLLPGQIIDEVIYEGYGPDGIAFMVACLTDNRNRTVGEVRHAFSKAGGSLGETNSVSWMFTRRARLVVETAADEDTATELALEVGADDVRPGEENGRWELLAADVDLGSIRAALLEQGGGVQLVSADLIYEPNATVPVEGDAAERVLRFQEALDGLEDVQEVFANFEISDAEFDRLAELI